MLSIARNSISSKQWQQQKESNHQIPFCLMIADNTMLITSECLFVSMRVCVHPISPWFSYKLQNVRGYANPATNCMIENCVLRTITFCHCIDTVLPLSCWEKRGDKCWSLFIEERSCFIRCVQCSAPIHVYVYQCASALVLFILRLMFIFTVKSR